VRGHFDAWITRRFTGRARPIAVAIFFPLYLIALFIGSVAVLEATIIALAASACFVGAEWLLLCQLSPIVLAARMAHALPWPLAARVGEQLWTTRVLGWGASRQTTSDAVNVLTNGATPTVGVWTRTTRAARVWT
jgi:hypothetical protein